MGSNIDCRDTDEVSVLLPPSPKPGCICAGDAVGGVASPRPAFPVMSNLLNASTSIDALPGLVIFGGEIAVSLPGFSIVSNVFENGFMGACEAGLTSSSPERSDVVLSNGSSSRGIGVGGLISKVSSPIVDEESGKEGVEGDGGGGDWTRTFFGAFFGISTVCRPVESARGIDC
jgi:hypothetical protein